MSKFTPIMEAITSVFQTTIGKEKALQAKNVKLQNAEISKLVDAHIVANDKPTKAEYMKGNSATNDARKEIKTLFEGLASAGFIEKSTVKSYQNSFWIAFEQGVPFNRNLANKKSADKKAETAKAETAKAGKVEVTTIAEMHKTLSKALAQGRLLNQLVFVPALLDFIVEHYPDFKETVLAK
jgi:hypothetical protein